MQRWNLPEGWVISARPARPALVTEADFIAVQDLGTRSGPASPAGCGYLLAGLLRCGTCGRLLESCWSNGKAAYRCRHGRTTATCPDPARPPNAYIREDQILPRFPALGIRLGAPARKSRKQRTARSPVPAGAAELISYLRAKGITLTYDPDEHALRAGRPSTPAPWPAADRNLILSLLTPAAGQSISDISAVRDEEIGRVHLALARYPDPQLAHLAARFSGFGWSAVEQAHLRFVVVLTGRRRSALAWAVRQARLTGNAVEAVLAWEFPATYGYPVPVMDVNWQELAKQVVTGAVGAASRSAGDVEIGYKVVEGNAAQVLLDASAGGELLVVGSRGHGGFAEALLGSVGQHCVHHAACPVVVIRDSVAGGT